MPDWLYTHSVHTCAYASLWKKKKKHGLIGVCDESESKAMKVKLSSLWVIIIWEFVWC